MPGLRHAHTLQQLQHDRNIPKRDILSSLVFVFVRDCLVVVFVSYLLVCDCLNTLPGVSTH